MEQSNSVVFKKRRTFYTDEKLFNARKNRANYGWAKEMIAAVIQEADAFVNHGHEYLWNIVTSQKIPRSYGVNQLSGCPVCKKEIDRLGNYPWLGDPVQHPWKLICPGCWSAFPSNDFAAYYESGKDASGFFNPELADRSLLINTLYPEKDENWCVDDGYGWLDPGNPDKESGRYTFVAYYNHWMLWYNGGVIYSALKALSEAYLFTADMRYACAGTILLDRIADVYPDMDSSVYKWKDGFRNSHGHSGLGKIVGCIWETELVKQFVLAYDALFPAMNHPDIIDFLAKKARLHQMHNRKTSVSAIRHNIESGILLQVYPAVKKRQIRGNAGMHQSALALAAVVLNAPEKSEQWVDHLFKTQSGGSGDLLKILVNDVDRDGHGNEASPSYNNLWLENLKLVADALEGSILSPSIDLYEYPKFRKLSHMAFPLIMLDNFTPSIGDTKKAGDPGIIGRLQTHLSMFERTGDPLLARFVYFLNGNKLEGLHAGIYSDAEKLCARLNGVIDSYGAFQWKSTHLTGYGFSALRDGKEETQRGLSVYYGRNTGHGHKDALNLGIYAFGMDLSPDHGYPCFADQNFEKVRWTANTISHNTVMVNQSEQENQIVGLPNHFTGEGRVRVIDVEAPSVYPQTTLYRRTTAMIQIDDERSYIVDIFRIKGGNEHLYSFHGAEGTVSAEGLSLIKQTRGTIAGEEIAYKDTVFDQSVTSGLNYLRNVERDVNPTAPFSVDWKVKDTWGVHPHCKNVHLRLTMLSEVDEAALADGEPPQNKPGNPQRFRYVLAVRRGADVQSQFVSVLEPYKEKRAIESITSAQLKINGKSVCGSEAYAVRVAFAGGRTDFIVNSLNKDETYTVNDRFEFRGFYGVCSFEKEKPVYAYLCEGSMIKVGERHLFDLDAARCLTGEVVYFTKEMSAVNEIVVRLNESNQGIRLIGKWIYIENDGSRNAVYEIKSVRADGERLILDIGDITLIRSWADDFDFSQGYRYDIYEGARFRIPMSCEWHET
ncbi:heparinase II/III family protein [Paenibacillus solisilvae]|uniref:Heparinase II/III family protein n=1 Tax=Paenibacillus solisilvae TaxID=2486751 RepID=A0ABW0VQM4_9BACL